MSEVALFAASGEPIATASIRDMSEGGFLVGYLPANVQATFAWGDRLRFRFVLPTGEVAGLAAVVRQQTDALRDRELALQLVTIDNEGGLHHLLSFLHSWFCGVD